MIADIIYPLVPFKFCNYAYYPLKKESQKGEFSHTGYHDILFFFLAVLGLHCCAQAFSSCSERGATLRCSAVASLVAEHGL